MDQSERRRALIRGLLDEKPEYGNIEIPRGSGEQRALLRALMNVRLPAPISEGFLSLQDEYLREENARRGVVELSELKAAEKGIYIWRGDITRLRCGAIVNAANSGLTGCYIPGHNCIDNCIHSFAGIQLRNFCDGIIKRQGHGESTGQAKISPAYNLPCDYVIHTVGPIVDGPLTGEHAARLESCYRSCLEAAEANGVKSIAFCCISTGVFRFPREKAAETAVRTVKKYLAETGGEIEVIFNVFHEQDEQIYKRLLG